jgi:large repetitive protein
VLVPPPPPPADTTPPVAPTLTLATDSGSSNTDGVTNVATINVAGLETGATWQYQVDGGAWLTGTGTSFNATAGSHTYAVRQTDSAGNTGAASTAITVVLDTSAPTISVVAPDSTNDTTPTITGSTDAPVGSTVTITVTQGTTQTLTATVQAGGTFSATPSTALANGPYTASASVADAAGNIGTDSDNGSVDTAAPTITVTAPDNTSDNTPTITGTTDAPVGNTVTVTVTDSAAAVQTLTTTVQAGGAFSVTPAALADGAYTVEASVTGTTGSTGTGTDTGSIDTAAAAPTLTLATDSGILATDGITNVGTLNVGGLESGATWQYQVDAGGWTAGTGTSFTATADSHTYSVRQTDTAGNASPASAPITVNFDTTAPTVSTVAITGATGIQANTLNAGDVVSVTVTMNDATTVTGTPQLALDIGGTPVLANYASGSGTAALVFNYTILAGQTDANGISITLNGLALNGGTLTDAAGNAATLTHAAVTDNADYMVDTTAPTANLISTVEGPVYTPTVISPNSSAMVASSEAGIAYLVNDTVTVANVASIAGAADNLWNSVAITGANVYTLLPATGLADGIYHLYTADAAGNLSAMSALDEPVQVAQNAPYYLMSFGDDVGALRTIPGAYTDTAGNYYRGGVGTTDTVTDDTTPTLAGWAPVGTTVTFTDYHLDSAISTPLSGTFTMDGSGNWTFTPTSDLAAGRHSITASTGAGAARYKLFIETGTGSGSNSLAQYIDAVTGTDIVSQNEDAAGFTITGHAAAGAAGTIRFYLDNNRENGVNETGAQLQNGVNGVTIAYDNATGNYTLTFAADSAALRNATGAAGSGVHQLTVDTNGSGALDAGEAHRLFLVSNGSALDGANYSVQDTVTHDVFVFYQGDPDGAGGVGIWTEQDAGDTSINTGLNLADRDGVSVPTGDWDYYNADLADGTQVTTGNTALGMVFNLGAQTWEFHMASAATPQGLTYEQAVANAGDHTLWNSNTSQLAGVEQLAALYAANFQSDGTAGAIAPLPANAGVGYTGENQTPSGWANSNLWTSDPSPSGHVHLNLAHGWVVDESSFVLYGAAVVL